MTHSAEGEANMTSETDLIKMVESWAKHYFFRSLTEFFNSLKNSELSLLQAYALTHLFFKGPIKISELCEHMNVSPGTASQMVDRLEKLEMVARIADPEDRRVRKVAVLDKGEKFIFAGVQFLQFRFRLRQLVGKLFPLGNLVLKLPVLFFHLLS